MKQDMKQVMFFVEMGFVTLRFEADTQAHTHDAQLQDVANKLCEAVDGDYAWFDVLGDV